ncbi:myosin light chain kinase family member 4 isoform X2 [Rhineura floridana]|uniref:myosin light chain kinase family member 4 isoform X2 n=1 Tax=Rhineura floridana TaxID=261503 RepID=UPI002AC8036C|nr:myosin light chain kinase family member 4 isoform X2 [Rhineura floridana]
MTTSSKQSVVNSLAKIFDPNALQNQRLEEEPSFALHISNKNVSFAENTSVLDMKVASLDQKISRLLTVQDNVLQKLDCVSQEIYSMEKCMDLFKGKGKESVAGPSTITFEKPNSSDLTTWCIEIDKKLCDMNKSAEQQAKRLDGLEQVVLGVQQLLGCLVEKVKTSTISDLIHRNEAPNKLLKVGGYLRKDRTGNLFRMQTFSDKKDALSSKWNEKERSYLAGKETKSIKKKKPPDSSEESDENSESYSHSEKVHKLNKENTEKAGTLFVQKSLLKSHTHDSKENAEENHSKNLKSSLQKTTGKKQADAKAKEVSKDSNGEDTKSDALGVAKKHERSEETPKKAERGAEGTNSSRKKEMEVAETTAQSEDTVDVNDPSKIQNQDVKHKDNEKASFSQKDEQNSSNDSPPPPAPFDHRTVSAKRSGINNFYHVLKGEVLGGGRFGQVHKCEEKSTGLKLAAKIIKARSTKEREEVMNEINVMNQLNHVNLIQLYDAFESKNDMVLIMEYMEGGELFDRIIDENCNLSEMDTILFIKQICEGIQYMHQMYILHLDLKPENILCVNREANQVKIIDFGLARRYKPREKLKVNFGTPEFLAPEVVNYDFVSFPTDMWSIGVIAYMLLSGLSPFLGDDDNETLNNILACRWDFDDQEFENVSEEAKDFISKLLIKEKGWRISATAALKHPWLSDQTLHCKRQSKKKANASAGSQAPAAP